MVLLEKLWWRWREGVDVHAGVCVFWDGRLPWHGWLRAFKSNREKRGKERRWEMGGGMGR